MKTIAEARELNRSNGWHFFERDTMRFFCSRVESAIVNQRYFITSERHKYSQARKRFSVRRINWDNGDIITVGEFQGYATKEQARKAIWELE